MSHRWGNQECGTWVCWKCDWQPSDTCTASLTLVFSPFAEISVQKHHSSPRNEFCLRSWFKSETKIEEKPLCCYSHSSPAQNLMRQISCYLQNIFPCWAFFLERLEGKGMSLCHWSSTGSTSPWKLLPVTFYQPLLGKHLWWECLKEPKNLKMCPAGDFSPPSLPVQTSPSPP